MLYSENLGSFNAYNATAVTTDANAVATALGPRLSAIACGNEPDGFVRDGWRPSPYTAAEYLPDAAACLAAVRAGAPNAPLEGADLTGAITSLAGGRTPIRSLGQLAWVGQHIFPAGFSGQLRRRAPGPGGRPRATSRQRHFATEASLLKAAGGERQDRASADSDKRGQQHLQAAASRA